MSTFRLGECFPARCTLGILIKDRKRVQSGGFHKLITPG